MLRENAIDRETLQAIDPISLLEKLRLTTGKAAEFCRVSRRQLCYWTDIGLVTALEAEQEEDEDEDGGCRRVYDFSALYKIMLIKQVLSRVKGLRRAAKETNDFLQQKERDAQELRASIEKKREAFLSQQADKLEALSRQVRDGASQINSKDKLYVLSDGLGAIQQLAKAISAGNTVLEEDPAACLRLATAAEQLEARLENLSVEEKKA